MADLVKKAVYYKIETSNRVGEGAKILNGLKEAKVNLLAFTGFPRRRKTQMDFVPENPAAFTRAAKKMGLTISGRKTCYLIEGRDREGAIADTLNKLSEGGINVTALNAIVAGKGRYGAILWVKKEDVRKASRILGAQ
jgi:hypothetical protein